MAEFLSDSQALESTTVKINRTAATVKGGRRMSFSALVVVGDRQGSVGIGYGKAPGVPAAIEKAQKDARKNLTRIQLNGGTITHPIIGRFGASEVKLIPAAPGTGVIAGGTVRAVLEMAGVQDCLTKSYGSTNEINVVKAVLKGLSSLRTRDQVAAWRNVTIESTTVDEVIAEGKRYLRESEEAAAEQAAAGKKQEKKKPQSSGKKPKQQAQPEQSEEQTPEAQAAGSGESTNEDKPSTNA